MLRFLQFWEKKKKKSGKLNKCTLLPINNNTPSIPLIGKDGDDVINKFTCELTGTESINTQIVVICKYEFQAD